MAENRMTSAKRLVFWSWYWIPLAIAYFMFYVFSLIGDLAYSCMEWIDKHPPKWR